jgi:glycosyltransferase involved in cell wall biosynthesis
MHRSKSRLSLVPLCTVANLVRATGPVILHCYLFRSQALGFYLKLRFPRVKFIFHEGGRILGSEQDPIWEPALFRLLLLLSRRSVDLYLANSAHTLRKLNDIALGRRIPSRVIYNSVLTRVGSPTEQERQDARRGLMLPESGFVIGFAGRLVRMKGWRDFLRAAEQLVDVRDASWLIAGDGPEFAEALAAVRANSNPRIRLLGQLSKMDKFYQAIDCCVVPSHWEAHGLVQIEAQAYGIPVIATDVPGMNETLNDGVNALLFPPHAIDVLSKQIRALLTSEDLRAQLSAGALRNAERFTINNYHEQLEQFYREL